MISSPKTKSASEIRRWRASAALRAEPARAAGPEARLVLASDSPWKRLSLTSQVLRNSMGSSPPRQAMT
jgi:hypothetical protein